MNIHWQDWCWSWSSNTSATWCKELIHWKRLWCWGRLRAGGEGGKRGWDSWVVSLTWWTWVWANLGRRWWTGKPGVLRPWGHKGLDTAEWLSSNRAENTTQILKFSYIYYFLCWTLKHFFFNLCYFKKLHLEKVMRAVLFKFGLQSVLWKSVFKRGWRFGLLLTPTHVWTWMRKQETRSRKQVSGLSDLPSPEMWVLEERNLTGKILFINIKQWFKMNHKHLRFC